MKTNIKILSLLLAICLAVASFVACGPADNGGDDQTNPPAIEEVDYAASVKLNMGSETLKQEVTVKSYIDGDTTHFYVPKTVTETGVLKARYLAVNTPESTGKIEEWGKKASSFTKEKLSDAVSIMIESDTEAWNLDSTGERHLVWVWYKTAEGEDYRNLNIEILQNGLALASSSADNRYGDTCMQAINQAKTLKLHVYSPAHDPDFYYGDAIPVTLKGLRSNISLYENMKVAFEGVVTRSGDQTIYVEEYDAETDMYYGMSVYYGWNLLGTGLEIIKPGNRIKVVGSVQYYAAGDSWQVSDVKYVDMRPNDPNNLKLISSGHSAANVLTSADKFVNGKVSLEVLESLEEDTTKIATFDYAKMALGSSIQMKNLKVKSIYTTSNEESSSKGAMTLTCEVDGITVSVRTVVLRDANGNLITASAYQGKTIDVVGIIDLYQGTYQIKVFSQNDITIVQ